jgi:hypothetical protein
MVNLYRSLGDLSSYKFAHADYKGKKIRIRSDDMEESTHSNGRRGYASHQGYTIPNYSPEGSPDFPDFHLYGHGLQAWAVYQISNFYPATMP